MIQCLCISEKDRRDVSRAVLDDNLRNTPARTAPLDADLYNKYVLNPRVENEGLTPCKAFFLGAFTPKERAEYREHPQKWVETVHKHVAERRDGNPKLLRMSPEAVWREGSADALSTSICLVSGLRAFGVPARIDPVTGKTQYASARGAWTDVADSRAAEKADAPGRAPARLAVSTVETPLVAEPRYYYHYSLSQVGADLLPRQMEWPEGVTVQEWLRQGVRLDPGQYMLTTGQRLADGGVLVRSELFRRQPAVRHAPRRPRAAGHRLPRRRDTVPAACRLLLPADVPALHGRTRLLRRGPRRRWLRAQRPPARRPAGSGRAVRRPPRAHDTALPRRAATADAPRSVPAGG